MGPEGELTNETPAPELPEQLSGVAVVIIIAVGVQTIIMLFIFAKRQIMRFTLRSRRGPHVSVGQGGVKSFRREIDRRLDYASHIKHEPKLCREGISETVPHHFRMLAVDKITELDSVIARYDAEFVRPAGANLRSFLIECLAGPLVGSDPKHVHVFCDMYEHARHSYKPFGRIEFNNYVNILSELKNLVIHNTQHKPDHTKSGTPSHNKPVNRPRKRIETMPTGNSGVGSTIIVQKNASTILVTQEQELSNSTHV